MDTNGVRGVTVLGAAIRGVVDAVLNPDVVFADFPRREEIRALRDDDRMPLSLCVEVQDYLEKRLGTYAFLRLGRKLGVAVMNATFPAGIETVEDAVAHVDAAHRMFCQPTIGGFELIERRPGRIVVKYTAPYNCAMQEGLFYEVAIRYGASHATVTHGVCRRNGDSACNFDIRF